MKVESGKVGESSLGEYECGGGRVPLKKAQ